MMHVLLVLVTNLSVQRCPGTFEDHCLGDDTFSFTMKICGVDVDWQMDKPTLTLSPIARLGRHTAGAMQWLFGDQDVLFEVVAQSGALSTIRAYAVEDVRVPCISALCRTHWCEFSKGRWHLAQSIPEALEFW